MEKISQIASTLQMLLTSLEPSSERAMVLRWKEEAELYKTRRENRSKILDAIKDGYDTLLELQNETGMPRATCYKILRRLEQNNLIFKTLVKKPNNRTEHRWELTAKQ